MSTQAHCPNCRCVIQLSTLGVSDAEKKAIEWGSQIRSYVLATPAVTKSRIRAPRAVLPAEVIAFVSECCLIAPTSDSTLLGVIDSSLRLTLNPVATVAELYQRYVAWRAQRVGASLFAPSKEHFGRLLAAEGYKTRVISRDGVSVRVSPLALRATPEGATAGSAAGAIDADLDELPPL